MKEKDFNNFYDSVEDLLLSIESYGSVDSDTLRKEISRVSGEMKKLSGELSNKPIGESDHIYSEIEVGDFNPDSLSPEMLGKSLSKLDSSDLRKASLELVASSPVVMVDTRVTGLIRISISDAQKIYKRLMGKDCDIETAQKAINKVSSNFNQNTSLTQQLRESFKEIDNSNLNALESLGFF